MLVGADLAALLSGQRWPVATDGLFWRALVTAERPSSAHFRASLKCSTVRRRLSIDVASNRAAPGTTPLCRSLVAALLALPWPCRLPWPVESGAMRCGGRRRYSRVAVAGAVKGSRTHSGADYETCTSAAGSERWSLFATGLSCGRSGAARSGLALGSLRRGAARCDMAPVAPCCLHGRRWGASIDVTQQHRRRAGDANSDGWLKG